jgi:hypothetical protein
MRIIAIGINIGATDVSAFFLLAIETGHFSG